MTKPNPLPSSATRRCWPIPRWVAASLLAFLPGALAAESITVVSWGGSYARACVEAYHKAFTAETGIEVLLEDYNGGLAQVRAQADAGAVHWDVVDLDMPDADLACDEGIIEPIDAAQLPPGLNGEAPVEDYPPNALSECGAGTLFSSTIYAYNTRFLEGPGPTTIKDFFDLEKFPGRRGMRRSPLANLEFALLADGVPLEQVYAVLDTKAGLERAFRKLDSIKDQVIWWEAGAQPPQMLADGEVLMSTAYNGRIFNAQVLEKQPFVIVWDGQVQSAGGPLSIVSGTPRLAAAQRFVRFANRPASIANVAKYISYSPTRRSARQLVGKHSETGIDMAPHMPTAPQNMKRALQSDWRWWSDNRDDMNERFSAWLVR